MSGDGIPVSKNFGLSHNHGNFPGKGKVRKMSEYKSECFEGDKPWITPVSAFLAWFCNSYKQNCSQAMQTKATAGTGNALSKSLFVQLTRIYGSLCFSDGY